MYNTHHQFTTPASTSLATTHPHRAHPTLLRRHAVLVRAAPPGDPREEGQARRAEAAARAAQGTELEPAVDDRESARRSALACCLPPDNTDPLRRYCRQHPAAAKTSTAEPTSTTS